MNNNTKEITTTAMLAAIACVVVVVGRIPVVLFLKYDPKDIIITLGGLIWGPLTSFTVSVIVSLIEMVTISENGILGCIMNIVSSCFFACTAAIYKKKRTLKGITCRFQNDSMGKYMEGKLYCFNYHRNTFIAVDIPDRSFPIHTAHLKSVSGCSLFR